MSRILLERRLLERERAILTQWHERRAPIEPLEATERIELADTTLAETPRRRGGLTVKQRELLLALVGRPSGLTARDCEAWLARSSPETGVIGWSASDCNVSLHRLQARGLVRFELIREGNTRLRWFITPEGEAALTTAS